MKRTKYRESSEESENSTNDDSIRFKKLRGVIPKLKNAKSLSQQPRVKIYSKQSSLSELNNELVDDSSDSSDDGGNIYIESDHTLGSDTDEDELETDDIKMDVPRKPDITKRLTVHKHQQEPSTTRQRNDNKLHCVYDGEFKSADDSTSVFSTVEDTEIGMNSLIIKTDSINELSHSELVVQFYSKLLPVFLKSNLILIELISIPEEFTRTIVKNQGVHKFFTFENIRVYSLDNATLLLDHHYHRIGSKFTDYIIKVVGRPVNNKLATFPTVLTTESNVFTGAGEKSLPSRHFVRSHVLRKNFALSRSALVRNSHNVGHQFSGGVPPGFWWNVYDPAIPNEGGFTLKIQEALQDRPVIIDLLFLLGEVNDNDNTINRIKGPAKWEPLRMKDAADRAAITVHTMLCFGFRILSFGMLCEYPKMTTDDLIAEYDDADEQVRRQAYASKRRQQMNTYKYIDTSVSGIKKRAVMRMAYVLHSTADIKNFFQVMDTHAVTMDRRIIRSRLFYEKTIGWDLVGRCYVYPNNSLYMVLGSCNMLYSSREMSMCTASLTASLLDNLNDQPRDDFDDVQNPNTIEKRTRTQRISICKKPPPSKLKVQSANSETASKKQAPSTNTNNSSSKVAAGKKRAGPPVVIKPLKKARPGGVELERNTSVKKNKTGINEDGLDKNH